MATSNTNYTAIGGSAPVQTNTTAPIQPPDVASWVDNTVLIYTVRIFLLGIVLPYTIHGIVQWRRNLQRQRTHDRSRERHSQGHQMSGLPSSDPPSAGSRNVGVDVTAVIDIEGGLFYLPNRPLQAYHPHSAARTTDLTECNTVPDTRSNTPAIFRQDGTLGTQETRIREASHDELGIDDIVEVAIETDEPED